MKRFLSILAAAVLAVGLCSCSTVDTRTENFDKYSAEYPYYEKSVDHIRQATGLTAQQSEDAFLILVQNCGVDSEITMVSEDGGGYKMYYSGQNVVVGFDGSGAVQTVTRGRDAVYPVAEKHNVLMDYELTEVPVEKDGKEVGRYAYIRIMKSQLQEITAENYEEFVAARVDGASYNWVSIVCDDGTGICFAGCSTITADYGNLGDDKTVSEVLGSITLDDGGAYKYTAK